MIVNSTTSKHVSMVSWAGMVEEHRFCEVPESRFIDNLGEIFECQAISNILQNLPLGASL